MKKISLAKRKAAGAFLLAALMISGLVFTACGKKTETVTQPAEETAEVAETAGAEATQTGSAQEGTEETGSTQETGSTAVSYTHLYVYKRQGWRRDLDIRHYLNRIKGCHRHDKNPRHRQNQISQIYRKPLIKSRAHGKKQHSAAKQQLPGASDIQPFA